MNSIFLFIILLIFINNILTKPNIDNSRIGDIIAVGNEIHQFQTYLKFPFDYQSFIYLNQEYENCYQLEFWSCVQCLWSKSGMLGNKITSLNKSILNLINCKYEIIFYEIVSYQMSSIHYKFVIKQVCDNNDKNISLQSLGGSSFDSFGMNEFGLISCKTHDLFNGNYNLTCILPIINENYTQLHLLNATCLNLTIYLTNQFYEAFSELYGQLTSNILLINNKQYCDKIKMSHNHIENRHYILNDRITFYSGSWINQSLRSDSDGNLSSIYRHRNIKDLSAYQFIQTKMTQLVYVNKLESNLLNPDISQKIGNQYKFQSLMITNDNLNININPTLNLTSLFERSSHQYHFIGSSHMRFKVHALLEYLYGDDVLKNIGQVDTNYHYRNIYSHTSATDYSNLYVAEAIDLIINLCGNVKTNFTLILQNGAWDLFNMNFRHMMNTTNNNQKLMLTLTNILSNPINSCPNLKHLIWLTAVPYPICHSSNTDCNQWRKYSRNSIISALNQNNLNIMIKSKVHSNIKLSIIDSFSIMKPRLVFNEYMEVTTTLHYLATLKEYGINSNGIVHTVAGDAELESLLLALASETQQNRRNQKINP